MAHSNSDVMFLDHHIVNNYYIIYKLHANAHFNRRNTQTNVL